MIGRFEQARRSVVTFTVAFAGVPLALHAQSGAGDGYLFHTPKAALALRVGVAKPSADSRIFSFASEQLTLDRGDFTGLGVAADLEVSVTSRVAVLMGTSMTTRSVASTYRDFVDNNDAEIEQSTSFRRAPVTAGLKWYLTPPGRSLGRFAWVPSRFSPYVAAGGGVMYYAFRQTGDFVDFEDLAVFGTTLESSGWTSTLYGSAGVNYSLSARMGLITEARYDRARAPMGRDFDGFDRIDLSGFSLSTGLHLRF